MLAAEIALGTLAQVGACSSGREESTISAECTSMGLIIYSVYYQMSGFYAHSEDCADGICAATQPHLCLETYFADSHSTGCNYIIITTYAEHLSKCAP